ncbi:hypothetical protein ACET3Z_005148 [Daucus carota]
MLAIASSVFLEVLCWAFLGCCSDLLMDESSEMCFKFKCLSEDSILSNVFNYDIFMMKVHDKCNKIFSTACQVGLSTDTDGAKDFPSGGNLNSPPRCHNVSNLDELINLNTKRKRKAFHCVKSSENTAPLLFDVFNYETSMMKDNGNTDEAMLVDKENTKIRQPLGEKDAGAHCQMKSGMKRKPLSPLNDRSRLNCDTNMSEVNRSPLMERQIPLQAKRKNDHPDTVIQKCQRKPVYGGGVAEETPKSTLCDIFNSDGGSSSKSGNTHTKKSFQYAPQILNFENPAVHPEHLKNLEEADIVEEFDGEDCWYEERMKRAAKG